MSRQHHGNRKYQKKWLTLLLVVNMVGNLFPVSTFASVPEKPGEPMMLQEVTEEKEEHIHSEECLGEALLTCGMIDDEDAVLASPSNAWEIVASPSNASPSNASPSNARPATPSDADPGKFQTYNAIVLTEDGNDGSGMMPAHVHTGDCYGKPELICGKKGVFAAGLRNGAVAAVGGQGYATLAEAYEYASPGDTIVLQQEIQLQKYLYVTKEITIDFNGYTIDASQEQTNQMAFWVGENGKLTLTGKGSLVGEKLRFGLLYVKGSNSEVALEDEVCLRDNEANSGGAVYLKNGKLFIHGGTIENTHATDWYGGAVYVADGTLEMTGGLIQNTTSSGYPSSAGGAVYLGKGSMTMSGGTISGCQSSAGGGIYLESGVFTMNGGLISGCKSDGGEWTSIMGGGISVAPDAGFFFRGGEIRNNESSDAGGGVSNYGVFEMTGGLIAENEARWPWGDGGDGGGIYVFNDGIFRMSGGIVRENRGIGGISICPYAEFYLTGGAVFDNKMNPAHDFQKGWDADIALMDADENPGRYDVLKASDMDTGEYHFSSWKIGWWEGENGHNVMKGRDVPEKFSIEQHADINPAEVLFRANVDSRPQVQDTKGIYLNGILGSDANNGTNSEQSVRSFGKAAKLADQQIKNQPEKEVIIYVCGTISVNGEETWSLPDKAVLKRAEGYGGFLADVCSGGQLTLENITMDGNRRISVYTNSLVQVKKGGVLNIGSGAVLQNNLAGGTRVISYDGGAVFCKGGTVNMTGGTIRGNESDFLGGGVSVSERGTFNMSGGEICSNRSIQGGGICAVRGSQINISGGVVSDNKAINGGGINLGAGTTAEAYCGDDAKQTFIMDGGVISDNEASACGGGIFIQMNSEATIRKGDITGNHTELGSGNHPFRGGGIYVNGGKQAGFTSTEDLPNGSLHLYNVEITDNTPGALGGGLAACPTADVKIYLTNGGIFHDNEGEYAKEIYVQKNTNDSKAWISDFMLGGGMYQWILDDEESEKVRVDQSYYQDTDEYIRMDNICSDEDIAAAQELAKVHITGNWTKSGFGGGIAANGDVVIGTKPQPDELKGKLKVCKRWEDHDNAEGMRPEAIKIDVRFGDYRLRGLELSADNDWTAEWENLPLELVEQADPEVELEEFGCEEYRKKEFSAEVVDNTLCINLTNEYAPTKGSLKIRKTVSGAAADPEQEFTFVVVLTGQDGSAFAGEVTYDGSKTGTIQSGGSILLKHGEEVTLHGIPAGTAYEVTETEAGQNGYKTTASGNTGTVIAGTSVSADFVNEKNPAGGGGNGGGGNGGGGGDGGGKTPDPGLPKDPSVPTPENPVVPPKPDDPVPRLVKAGDDSLTMVWLLLSGMSLAGLIAAVIFKKKQKHTEPK